MNTTLLMVAREACEKHDDIDSAAAHVRRYLDDNEDVKDEIIDELIDSAIRECIHRARHNRLTLVKKTVDCPPADTRRGPEVMAAVGKAMLRSFLDRWSMPDGRVLGDWNGKELLVQAASERARADGHDKRGRFFEKIGKLVGDAIVRDRISSDKAEEIAKKIWKQKEAGGKGQCEDETQSRSALQPA